MNKILFNPILILSLCLTPTAYAKPVNLTCAKNAVIAYYNDLAADSAYVQDVDVVIQDAEKYLDTRVAENNRSAHPAKLALVLDIDDTSLSNYPAIKADDFSNAAALIDARYHAATAPAVAPVMRLYKEAVDKGVYVIFISARKPLTGKPFEDLRPYTITNLSNAGYTGWTALYIPNQDEVSEPSASYKTKIRKMLSEEQGYDIILNVGDQDSDLAGGYADHTDEVPNALYSTSSTPCGSQRVCEGAAHAPA